ncbi:PH domain-containing protein [Streptomyces sp. CB02613]|uniref:PH domain-containing protein n=1 Tax=Streptomyces sp. CB02613 TaxID=2020328 RepID=UPI00131C04FF|nr:PH domain-containing protein [Streptomyces sp. CB02613]
MFATRAAEHATTIVPTVIAGVSVSTRWPVLFGIPVGAVFALVGAAAVLGLVVDWWMTRFFVTGDGIRYDSGLVVRRSTSIGWSDVVSVQVSRSAVAQFLGCSRVLIGIGTESKATLVIEAVPQAVAAEVQEHFEAGRVRRSPDAPAPAATGGHPVDPDDLIHRIGLRDYLLISVTYGQFVLLFPFLLELYENAAALLPLPPVLPALSDLPGPLWAQVAAGVAVVGATAMAFGTLIAWLRYRGFEVRLGAGVFAMSGGLISAESRQIPRSQVGGVRIQQNPLMRVSGYARLAFVSRQSGERIGANLVFPAARIERVRDSVRSHFPAYATAADQAPEVSRPLRLGLIGMAAATLALTSWAASTMPPVRAVALAAAVAIVLLAAANYCWAAVEHDPDHSVLHFRRGFLWVTHYVVPWDSVYFAHSHQLPVAGRLSVGAVCLGVYDTRAVRLWIPVGRPLLMDRFIETTATAAPAAPPPSPRPAPPPGRPATRPTHPTPPTPPGEVR